MNASNAAHSGDSSNRAITLLRAVREKLQSPLSRCISLAGGMACIAYSQYLLEHRPPLQTPNPIARLWNEKYQLEIVNYDNLYFALPYFIVGAILCALTITPVSWKEGFRNWASTWPASKDSSWKSVSLLVGISLFAILLFQLGRHQYAEVYFYLWLVSILLITRFFWRWDKNGAVDLSLGFSSADLFWISGLLLLGFGISAYALSDIPVILIPDEGRFWETARAIVIGEIDPVFFDSGVYTFPVASSIFQAWVMRWFGVSFWAWRFASVIAGVLAVIPLYLLAREWFGRAAAIMACVMMIANPYFISFNRMGYNNSQALFPVTLCIYFFAVGARKGSYFYIWLAGLAAGLGFYTYFAAWIGLVTLCLGVLYLLAVREVHFKRGLAILGIILAAWGVMFLPRIAYTASGSDSEGLIFKIFETSFINTFYGLAYYDEAALTRVSPFISVGEHHTLFYNPEIYGELILRAVIRTFIANFNPLIVSEHFLNTGFAGVITPVFFLTGIVLAWRCRRQLRFGLPLLWCIGGMVLLSIFNAFPPRHTHLVSIIPVLALISAGGFIALIESVFELVPAKWIRIKRIAEIILIGSIAFLIMGFGVQRYFVKMPTSIAPPFEDVTSWIAWRTQAPVHIYYLAEADTPHRVKYLVDMHIVPHTYTAGIINEFSTEANVVANYPAIIFVDTLQTEGLSIIDHPPPGFRQPVQYHHQDGYSYGYALTNTIVDLNPQVGLEDGWNSIQSTPVRWVLILLILPLLWGLVWNLHQARLPWIGHKLFPQD